MSDGFPDYDEPWRHDLGVPPGADGVYYESPDVKGYFIERGRLRRPESGPEPGGGGRSRPERKPADRLNVLWIMFDQLRADVFGFAGHPSIHTPNFDRLAARGVVFERSYCTSPLCCPSRASMLTGQHLPEHEVLANGRPMKERSKELIFTRRLTEAGYRTANVGKHHAGVGRDEVWEHYEHVEDAFGATAPKKVPFDPSYWPDDLTFMGERCDNANRALYGTYPGPFQVSKSHVLTTQAMRFLYYDTDPRPFLLRVSYDDPHSPIVPPEPFASMYGPEDVPEELMEGVPGIVETKSKTMRDNWRLRDWDGISEEDHRLHAARYMAMVSHVDFQTGRLLDYLEALGYADDTLILFNSDHGHMIGENAMAKKGLVCYEGVCRVPTVLCWPGELPAGRRVDALVDGREVPPTLLSACGVDAPPGMQGRDLLPLARGQGDGGREYVVSCWEDYIYALIGRRWKLIWFDPDDAGELYDLEKDRYEQNNLWADESVRDVREELVDRLMRWRREHGCPYVPGPAFAE